jgi:hypothetical protein
VLNFANRILCFGLQILPSATHPDTGMPLFSQPAVFAAVLICLRLHPAQVENVPIEPIHEALKAKEFEEAVQLSRI